MVLKQLPSKQLLVGWYPLSMQQDLLPLCANQLSSSAYVSTMAFPITQHNSYPAQTQSKYSGQYSHTP